MCAPAGGKGKQLFLNVSDVHVFVQVEKLLIEQNRLRDQNKLQEDSLALKEKELQLLQRMVPAQPKVNFGPGVHTEQIHQHESILDRHGENSLFNLQDTTALRIPPAKSP